MTTDTQHTDNGPSDNRGAVPVVEQLVLCSWLITDLLYDLHASGATLADVVAAWLWLDAQAASCGG